MNPDELRRDLGQAEIDVPMPAGGWAPAWTRAWEIARAVPAGKWVLVGGLMVQAHLMRQGVGYQRPTADVDMVVEIHTVSIAGVVRDLRALGYEPHESINERAPFHRLTRPGASGGVEVVDVMAPDLGKQPRFRGRSVLEVPGGRSALADSELLRAQTEGGVVEFRVPRLPAAVALKGAAYGNDSRDRDRHLEDGVALLSCVEDVDAFAAALSKSMRKNFNKLVLGLGTNRSPWRNVPPQVRDAADAVLTAIRSDWRGPTSAH